MRYLAIAATAAGTVFFAFFLSAGWFFVALFALCAGLTAIGLWDMVQRHHSLRRNYPILANLRYLLEKVRPEIRQYFLESDVDGTPFNRSKRAIVYQRAKGQLDKRPFGTQQDIYAGNYEWINHSLAPQSISGHDFRVTVGGPQRLGDELRRDQRQCHPCAQPRRQGRRLCAGYGRGRL
jgi:glutamate synthase domain-containing protein 2